MSYRRSPPPTSNPQAPITPALAAPSTSSGSRSAPAHANPPSTNPTTIERLAALADVTGRTDKALEQITQHITLAEQDLQSIQDEIDHLDQKRLRAQAQEQHWRELRLREEHAVQLASQDDTADQLAAIPPVTDMVTEHLQDLEQQVANHQQHRDRHLHTAQQWAAIRQSAEETLTRLTSDDRIDYQQNEIERLLNNEQHHVDSSAAEIREAEQRRAAAYAQAEGWREVRSRTATLVAQVEGLGIGEEKINDEHQRVGFTQQLEQDALRDRDQATIKHQEATQQTQRLAAIIDGIRTHGFGNYLMRAADHERAIIMRLHQEALREGAKSAGRPPSTPTDERKARRAAKARARRAAEAAQKRDGLVVVDADEEEIRRAKHRDQRRQARLSKTIAAVAASVPLMPTAPMAVAGSQPGRRQHEERIALMAPDERIPYVTNLLRSRERGHQAAIDDAEFRHQTPALKAYIPPHLGISCGGGNRIIAIRGGDPESLASLMLDDPSAMDRWLAEPGERRNHQVGPRSRLSYVAGQVLAAWSPALAERARIGGMDAAAAYEVDRMVARFDLIGHRVVAILHIDSESGHPHLHILFSRVRESDLTLWSMDGRERTPALWLHARSNTVLAAGTEALDHDVDALGGWGDAAWSGELLMLNQRLTILRKTTDGNETKIPVQGPTAAQRLAAVGTMDDCLAGGIWRFGLGKDQEAVKAWKHELAAAENSGEAQRIEAVKKLRPLSRGYWLRPVDDPPSGSAWAFRAGYGWYLLKRAQ